MDACSLIANSHRVDMRWPLLDRRLMQQYFRTPAIEKDHRGLGRYLHRRAIAGTVPDTIAWRRSKSMGGNPQWSLETDLPMVRDWASLPSIFRSIIDEKKLNQTLSAIAEFKPGKSNIMHLQRRKMLMDLEIACRWLDNRQSQSCLLYTSDAADE